MATFYATEVAGIDSTPKVAAAGNVEGARLFRFRASIVLAAQASGSIFILNEVPAGYVYDHTEIVTDTSLATATFGVTGQQTANTYVAAGQTQTVTTPVIFKSAAAVLLPALTIQDRCILTTGVAALPGAGNLIVDMYFSRP